MNQINEEIKSLIRQLEKKVKELISAFSNAYALDFKEIIGYRSLSNLSEIRLNPFKISNQTVNNAVIAAPMAGISDNTYRIFAKYFGSSLTFSEMAASFGLIYNHERSFDIASVTDFERPCAVQIFGNNPDVIAEAASLIEENADIVDINMGCPVPKVLKTGSGGYLLRDPERIRNIVRALKQKIKKPVTVKLRLGWDESSINVLDIAKIAESEGADAVAIHGRTVKQGYSGKADYEHIRQVKSAIKIPVIASGDIDNAYKAKQVLDHTGCEGLMAGRVARGNPWIFTQLLLGLLSLKADEYPKRNSLLGKNIDYQNIISGNDDLSISNNLKIDILLLYLKFLIYFKGEYKAVKEFRKITGWAFKGKRDISSIRNEFFKMNNFSDAEKILENLKET